MGQEFYLESADEQTAQQVVSGSRGIAWHTSLFFEKMTDEEGQDQDVFNAAMLDETERHDRQSRILVPSERVHGDFV